MTNYIPRVYVVHQQMMTNHNSGTRMPKFNLKQAYDFGEVIYVLAPEDDFLPPQKAIAKLKHKLQDFCADDYLLLLGSPFFTGMATAIVADYMDGNFKLLQWSGKERLYGVIEVTDLFVDLPRGEPA